MATLFKTLIAVTFGVMLGLGATYAMLERGSGFGAVQIGPWKAWPRAGGLEADPYSRAIQARSGETPLGAAEGLSFMAASDSDGAPLEAACSYVLKGDVPAARLWTLTLMSPTGTLVENALHRFGFTSREILRQAEEPMAIAISSQTQPGNWLPNGASGRFVLVLRLYDTPLSGALSGLEESALPRLEKGACL